MFSKANAKADKVLAKKNDLKRKKTAPTIISADVKVGGDLASDGEVQMDGTVHGDVSCNKLSLGKTAAVIGSVNADELLVRGKVNGEIRARIVVFKETARVQGDVFHETLCIEPGAQLEGHCRRLNPEDGNSGDSVGINLVVDDGSVKPLKTK
ncbi:MAG: cell shape determination protein CcmA [Rhodospirillaceae bacterium]|nr:cell shape determination protein CcmA [Rhodospirillaceae bacterium]|tara:strand:+ start:2379 stop:2837 length:459 start_codon:yes stop_codon:yes gene_type:complete